MGALILISLLICFNMKFFIWKGGFYVWFRPVSVFKEVISNLLFSELISPAIGDNQFTPLVLIFFVNWLVIFGKLSWQNCIILVIKTIHFSKIYNFFIGPWYKWSKSITASVFSPDCHPGFTRWYLLYNIGILRSPRRRRRVRLCYC